MKTFNGLCVCSVVLTLFFLSNFVSCKVLLPQSSEEVFVITTSDYGLRDESATEFSTASSDSSLNNDENDVSGDLMTEDHQPNTVTRKRNDVTKTPTKPEIYSFQVQSDIRYRYSRTYVTSRVANRDKSVSQEVTFRVVLPETAFISKFVMEIDGKNYEAYVKEKEEAKKVYNEAQSQGQSAGLVELNSRHSNIFNVNVNIKAQSKVTFNLTYEELLSRRLGRYEQIINISPEQVTNVKDFKISVNIEESQNVTFLRVPNLRNDIEAQQDAEGNNKDAVIVRPAGNRANITWSPSEADQAALSKQGIAGKFVVQYDINRSSNAGEVLVMEGYFVHFFAPTNLKPLRKHVIFILDISGSMWGRKMEQLKESQKKILEDLSPDDFFNIITFSSDVFLWSPDDVAPRDPNSHYYISPPFHGETTPAPVISEDSKKQPLPATRENIDKAKKFIDALVASGGTNIHDAITVALNLTESIRKARNGKSPSSETTAEPLPTALPLEDTTIVYSDDVETTISPVASTTSASPSPSSNKTILPDNVESLVIFLTDGEPTVGISNPHQIQTLVQAANKNLSVPIFSLAFGEGADFQFVRKLSLQNYGFARKIYEASDAVLQLKGFYNEIASPLLSNVTFNYTSPEYNITDVTITKFPTVFGGTEIAVAGKLNPLDQPEINPTENPIDQLAVESGGNGNETASKTKTDRRLVVTDKYYFDATVIGSGREGLLDFSNPEVFSETIPWGIPDIRPYPPRPTAPPSQEDQFLERLWAYLTIQQLIDVDLAEIDTSNSIDEDQIQPTPSAFQATSTSTVVVPKEQESTANTTTIKETPKQQALRLALKYSFVTPLTSLVVVKPNASDITNADSTDAKPHYADSLSSPQSMPAFAVVKAPIPHSKIKFAVASLTANRIGSGNINNFAALPLYLPQQTPFLMHNQQQNNYGAQPGPLAHYQPSAHGNIVGTPSSFGGSPSSLPYSTTFAPRTTQRPQTTESATTSNLLTLQDVQWFRKEMPTMSVNMTDYAIKQNQTSGDSIEGEDCTIRSTSTKGQCRHLKDCVRSEFIDDIQLFKDSYFCPLQSRTGGAGYVGTCCARETQVMKTMS